jgi:hypothetical protein
MDLREVAARLLAAGLFVSGSALAAAGCGDDDGHHDHEHGDGGHEMPIGPPTGSVCPDDSELTYENFGQQFMEDYCTRCHSRDLEGPERMNAPEGHDFDWVDGVRFVADHIDQYAAAGPEATNLTMPPSEPRPTLEEREMLGEWLACGAP